MTNPRDVIPVLNEPLNRLLFAINHYVSTGEHIGVGVAYKDRGRMRFVIPVRPTSGTDRQDFACFRSRFDELAEAYGMALGYMGEYGDMEGWTFAIDEDRMDALAADLQERPGPLGWGSMKPVIDAHEWRGN